jgi:hypothetical protein
MVTIAVSCLSTKIGMCAAIKLLMSSSVIGSVSTGMLALLTKDHFRAEMKIAASLKGEI